MISLFEYLGEGFSPPDTEFSLIVIMRVPGRVSQKGLILNIGFEGLSRLEIQSSLTKHHTSLI